MSVPESLPWIGTGSGGSCAWDDVTRQLVDQGMREAQQTIEKAASEPATMATDPRACPAGTGSVCQFRWVAIRDPVGSSPEKR